MSKLSFSGHESFQCRNLWLKKGYDFINLNWDFNNDTAVVELGVGKNMVTSIKYWLKAFDLIDETESTRELASIILDQDGRDPYLEDIGTLWFLHYKLVTTNKASIYNLYFNFFRKQRIEFSKEHLLNYLKSECIHQNESHSEKTIETDIGVFLKNYITPNSKSDSKDIEDSFSSLLIELDLIKPIKDRKDWYECRNEFRASLPTEIVLYAILENENFGKSISFNHLLNDENSPGVIFALDADSLVKHILEITKRYEGCTYKEDAGVRELQLNSNLSSLNVLENYYE